MSRFRARAKLPSLVTLKSPKPLDPISEEPDPRRVQYFPQDNILNLLVCTSETKAQRKFPHYAEVNLFALTSAKPDESQEP